LMKSGVDWRYSFVAKSPFNLGLKLQIDSYRLKP